MFILCKKSLMQMCVAFINDNGTRLKLTGVYLLEFNAKGAHYITIQSQNKGFSYFPLKLITPAEEVV